MLRLYKWLAASLATLAFAAPCWAGFGATGTFTSNQSTVTKVFAPGEIFTITLTANTADVTGVQFLTPFTLSPNAGGQFQIVPGGTCAPATAYLSGSTCTVRVQFTGLTAGSFSANLLGQCQLSSAAAVGGYSISCNFNSTGTGQQGTLGRFAGEGVAAMVDTLGATGFATLLLALLSVGAFFTLRRPA